VTASLLSIRNSATSATRYWIEGRSGTLQPGQLLAIAAKDQFDLVGLDRTVGGLDEWPLRVFEVRVQSEQLDPGTRALNIHHVERVSSMEEVLGPRAQIVTTWLDSLVNRCGGMSAAKGADMKRRCETLLAEHVRRIQRRGGVLPLRIEWLDSWQAVMAWSRAPAPAPRYDAAIGREHARLAATAGSVLERVTAHGVRMHAMGLLVRAHGAALLRSAFTNFAGGFQFAPSTALHANALVRDLLEVVDPIPDELSERLLRAIATSGTGKELVLDVVSQFFRELYLEIPERFRDLEPELGGASRAALLFASGNWVTVMLPLLTLVANHTGALVSLPFRARDVWEPLTAMFELGVMPLAVTGNVKLPMFAPLDS